MPSNSRTMIDTITSKYDSRGILKGSELLLQPNDALLLADDLAAAGILIIGIELWYTIQRDAKEYFVEDPYGPNFSYLLQADDAVPKANASVKHYLTHELPARISRVSFTEYPAYPHIVFRYNAGESLLLQLGTQPPIHWYTTPVTIHTFGTVMLRTIYVALGSIPGINLKRVHDQLQAYKDVSFVSDATLAISFVVGNPGPDGRVVHRMAQVGLDAHDNLALITIP